MGGEHKKPAPNSVNEQSPKMGKPRSREVSSRYMLPTISSSAACSSPSNNDSPSIRRSNSPNSRSSRIPNVGFEISSPSRSNGRTMGFESPSVERRSNSRPRGPPGLWPATSAVNSESPTATATLGDHLGMKKKVPSSSPAPAGVLSAKDIVSNSNVLHSEGSFRARGRTRGEPWKENVNGFLMNSTKSTVAMNRSMDAGSRLKNVARSSSLNLPGRSFRNNDVAKAPGLISRGRLSVDLERPAGRAVEDPENENENENGDHSFSSEETGDGKKPGKKIVKGSYVPARFLQDTLSRLRRMSESGHLVGNGNGQKVVGGRGFSSSSSSLSSISTSSTWGASPGRERDGGNGNGNGNMVEWDGGGKSRMSSVLNFGMEMLKGGKVAKVKSRVKGKVVAQEEILHQLRMLQNRFLQWRFVNARARDAQDTQVASAQTSLYHVWLKTSELRSRVVIKRVYFYKARHQHKLHTVVAAHAAQLDDWAGLKDEHEWAVTRTMECLDAATQRVPLVAGATADVHAVKQVIRFAVDVMHGIKTNATRFLLQAEKVDALLPELAETVAQEIALLQECVELLAGLTSLEVEENSLRTHLVQLHQQKLRPQ